ncbi:MAG TPA: glycerol dehydrogenase [Methanomassiliicoccales archaeon]|nr:glycerol dehydrogenase [Methanomassiliicoccales archaeon]
MISREVAWRIFAAEFNSSSYEIKGEGEKAPSFLISPLGAKINRVFIVGVLTDNENVGNENEPVWRAKITDPTGTFYLTAGQYQPEASMALAKLQPPCFVAVVGKFRTYSPEEGKLYVSIRPERIGKVEAAIRDNWVLETCKASSDRISAMEEAMKLGEPDADKLMQIGFSLPLAEGAALSVKHYHPDDLTRYRAMVVDALKFLLPEYQIGPDMSAEAAVPEEIEIAEEDDVDKEALVLAMIESLDSGRGAAWDEVVKKSKEQGIEREELDTIANSLLDKGFVYEPVLGRMRKI